MQIHFRDESRIEAAPDLMPSAGNGRYAEWNYRLNARRPMTNADIFSVTVSLGDETFEVMPW